MSAAFVADDEQEREALVAEINALCSELNKAGAVPRWTPRFLDEFVNQTFEVIYGMDSMTGESFPVLRTELEKRLEALKLIAANRKGAA